MVQCMLDGLSPDGRSLFDSAMGLLVPAAEALYRLANAGRLTFCFATGDGHTVIEQHEASGAGAYDRICLSNVPDYTSLLNAFLYRSTRLEPTPTPKPRKHATSDCS
jgi:hypothetical protein